jgi:hypothetical protein
VGDHVAKTQPAGAGTNNPVPNFRLVGAPCGTASTIANLLRFARVVPAGRNRWYVEARPLEWVFLPGHTVWFTPGGQLACDCRQAVAGRECEHALAVRHLGSTSPPGPDDPRQMRLIEEPEPVVRAAVPSRRFRVEYKVQPLVHRARPVPARERADG